MAGRKTRDAADARRCLRAVQSSGLGRVEWAHEHGIDARSLNVWRLNLARGAKPEPTGLPMRLVELVASAAPVDVRYVVRVGDLAVEVDDRFDDVTLRRLLRVVASC